MPNYTPTIGLEIHVELKTTTKMFCRCKNDSDETRPNVNVCPVCMAHPGTLPVPNFEAIRAVLRVGEALGSDLADFTEFDRKNYFYPDIPKGYQISQYKYPLVSGGELAGVKITRIHLEEDTGSNMHEADVSLINYNRAGVPLMELVTEPCITSAKQAGDFARELQLLLGPDYLNVSEVNMEKGEMRVEANISISPTSEFGLNQSEGLVDRTRPENNGRVLGTKVEVKNLNSISGMERAINYELKRQEEVLEKGEVVIQETRGWDDAGQKTYSQRKKESSHDYRYFPDPDLPKFYISEIPELNNLKITLPELPAQKRDRLKMAYGIKDSDIEIFVSNKSIADLFETVAKELNDPAKAQLLANYINSDLAGLRKTNPELLIPEAGAWIELINLAAGGEISSRGAKDILAILTTEGGSPKQIAETKGLFQKSDEGALLAIIDEVIKANDKVVLDYKGGNERSLQFLVGQGMKASKGSANPQVLAELFKKQLG